MKVLQLVTSGATALAVLVFAGPLACTPQGTHDHAAHGHPGHADAADAEDAVPAARNYADAVRQIRSHMAALDAVIKSGDHDAVHKDSVAIGKLCDAIAGAGGLAAARGSPVPKDKVDEVADSARQLSAASRSFHKAAHADDLAQVTADYRRMGDLVESLARYAPGR